MKFVKIIPFLIFFLTFTTQLSAQIYQWTDENGVVHFTDTPPPAGTSKTLKVIQNKEVQPYVSSSQEQLLSDEELNFIEKYKDLGFLPKEIVVDKPDPIQVKQLRELLFTISQIQRKKNTTKEISEVELGRIDSLLRRNWKNMVESMAGHNVEEALTYFVTPKRSAYRKIFSNNLSATVDSLQKLHLEQIIESDNEEVKYSIYTEVVKNGQKEALGSMLIFMRDFDGE